MIFKVLNTGAQHNNMQMRGQGLPITSVILIIMAIIILIFALVFIILPIVGVGTPPAPDTNMSSFTFNCQTYCGQPNSPTNDIPANSKFCTSAINYQGTTYHCYDSYAGKTIATCSYTAYNGTFFSTVNAACCTGTGKC